MNILTDDIHSCYIQEYYNKVVLKQFELLLQNYSNRLDHDKVLLRCLSFVKNGVLLSLVLIVAAHQLLLNSFLK